MKNLLGIDIDGVFNIMSYDDVEGDINKTPVVYLNKIIEVVPNCDILITSSWGNKNNKTTKALVNAGFKYPEKIVGVTGCCNGEYSRSKEISEWLNNFSKSEYYKNYVYIDDEIELFDYSSKNASRYNVVQCRADRGLDLEKSYETICRLQGISLKFWC